MKHNEVRHEIKKSTLKVTIAGLFAAGVLLSAAPVFSGTVSTVKPVVSTDADSKIAYGCWPKSWKIANASPEEKMVAKVNYFRNIACQTRGTCARKM